MKNTNDAKEQMENKTNEKYYMKIKQITTHHTYNNKTNNNMKSI